jgi:hypothetical protein
VVDVPEEDPPPEELEELDDEELDDEELLLDEDPELLELLAAPELPDEELLDEDPELLELLDVLELPDEELLDVLELPDEELLDVDPELLELPLDPPELPPPPQAARAAHASDTRVVCTTEARKLRGATRSTAEVAGSASVERWTAVSMVFVPLYLLIQPRPKNSGRRCDLKGV